MNRKNLIGLMAAVAAMAALCGCASTPAPQQTADMRQEAAREFGIARNVWADCIRVAIPRLDDPESSAGVLSSHVVARAAMKDCSNEYRVMMGDLARTLAPSCSRDRDCRRAAMATAEHKAMTAATQEVMNARIRAAGAAALQCE